MIWNSTKILQQMKLQKDSNTTLSQSQFCIPLCLSIGGSPTHSHNATNRSRLIRTISCLSSASVYAASRDCSTVTVHFLTCNNDRCVYRGGYVLLLWLSFNKAGLKISDDDMTITNQQSLINIKLYNIMKKYQNQCHHPHVQYMQSVLTARFQQTRTDLTPFHLKQILSLKSENADECQQQPVYVCNEVTIFLAPGGSRPWVKQHSWPLDSYHWPSLATLQNLVASWHTMSAYEGVPKI